MCVGVGVAFYDNANLSEKDVDTFFSLLATCLMLVAIQ